MIKHKITGITLVLGFSSILAGCGNAPNAAPTADQGQSAAPVTNAAAPADTTSNAVENASSTTTNPPTTATPATTAPAAATTTAPAASATGTGEAGSTTTTTAVFTDITGLHAEQAIKDLAALGVFETTGGEFKPFEPVTRREYVRWLVKANNKYSEKDYLQIRVAEEPESSFVDVKPADPDFKYIQGLANAGYIVGVDQTHFAPDKTITREEMIMVKAQCDEATELKANERDKPWIGYSDKDEIDPNYISAFYHDRCATTTTNGARIWGSVKKIQPKKQLTRAEAAISVSVCRSGDARKAAATMAGG